MVMSKNITIPFKAAGLKSRWVPSPATAAEKPPWFQATASVSLGLLWIWGGPGAGPPHPPPHTAGARARSCSEGTRGCAHGCASERLAQAAAPLGSTRRVPSRAPTAPRVRGASRHCRRPGCPHHCAPGLARASWTNSSDFTPIPSSSPPPDAFAERAAYEPAPWWSISRPRPAATALQRRLLGRGSAGAATMLGGISGRKNLSSARGALQGGWCWPGDTAPLPGERDVTRSAL